MLVLADAAGDQDLFKLVIDYHRDRDWDRIITLNQEQTLREFATPCYLAFMHRWSYCGTYGLRIKDDKECGSGCIAKTLWSFAHEIWENYRDCRATSPYMVISKGTMSNMCLTYLDIITMCPDEFMSLWHVIHILTNVHKLEHTALALGSATTCFFCTILEHA